MEASRIARTDRHLSRFECCRQEKAAVCNLATRALTLRPFQLRLLFESIAIPSEACFGLLRRINVHILERRERVKGAFRNAAEVFRTAVIIIHVSGVPLMAILLPSLRFRSA